MMMDHRWIVASLIEMHDYAERFDLEGVAENIAAAIEKVSPALGGAGARRLVAVSTPDLASLPKIKDGNIVMLKHPRVSGVEA